MRAKVAQWLIAFALIIAVGGHWAVLQSVAWFGMVVSYSQDVPLSLALEKTFDGKNPCTLCKAVNEGKKSEREHASVNVETKLELCLVPCAMLLEAPAPLVLLPGEAESANARFETPPTPPPRAA